MELGDFWSVEFWCAGRFSEVFFVFFFQECDVRGLGRGDLHSLCEFRERVRVLGAVNGDAFEFFRPIFGGFASVRDGSRKLGFLVLSVGRTRVVRRSSVAFGVFCGEFVCRRKDGSVAMPTGSHGRAEFSAELRQVFLRF